MELHLLDLYLENCLMAVRSWARQHWTDSGWSPTFLPMLLHATLTKCKNSWSASTGGYRLAVVQIPRAFGLKPLWPINASPLGGSFGGEDYGKMYIGSKLLKSSYSEGSWSTLGDSAAWDSCDSAPIHVQNAVILEGAKKLNVCLSSGNVQLKHCNRGWHLPSIHDLALVEMQRQSAFSFETEGWG